MKVAVWTTKRLRTFPAGVSRSTLRKGYTARGKNLGQFIYWSDSRKSLDASDIIAKSIERAAVAEGYIIHGTWRPRHGSWKTSLDRILTHAHGGDKDE